ncbi:YbaB/EbfC family DNA-binding protein [Oribacterium parvum ACB1]|jgi:DNA-binding protein, ybaB/ebfC family|uniref:Nucleoid-associated protein HMPREF9625_01475 n=1 Tax=Oribacterium parvum ACB1 TaxID=796943 RepID=G9WQ42_9FIRM|nr:YbaB/EbfC family nucleoid-associated protein [Oribacterium parvum]EHL10475.1 YbaB/EbfC family DNA-binding protein [Oribacterium parvum ACB1]EJF12276.1 DNA-binding protein, YbaB/EbfC family [Oribacterium parvum ACB8]MBF1268047.1 YbaB/EbfC family nucleoid-associated protein [Oribacterium parvum]
MAKHGGFAGGMPGMNMNNLMKQYQKMQKKLEETQEELAKKEYTGQAGGGAVKIVISGEKKVLKVSLNKDAVDPEDVETLEEMIALAVNQALTEIEKDSSQEMGRLTGGMGLGF